MEMLIYIAVSSVVILAILGVFFALSRGRGQVEARGEVNSNLRFAIEKISQELKISSAIVTPASAGATSTALVATITGGNVTYCVIEGRLHREPAGGNCTGASETITYSSVSVENILFTRLENTNTVLPKTVVSIVINLDIKYNSASPEWQYSSSKQTAVSLR